MPEYKILLFSLILSFSPLAISSGQETAGRNPLFESETRVRYMPGREAVSQSGKVSITEVESSYSYEVKAFGKLPVDLLLETEYIGIDNSAAVKLPSALTRLGAGFETTLPFFNLKNTYFSAALIPTVYGSEWNFRPSNSHVQMYYYAARKLNEKLTLIGGIAIFPKFRYRYCPILGMIYKPNQRLSFNLTPADPNISYRINDKTALYIEGSYLPREYKVDKENQKNLSFEYTQCYLGSGVTRGIGRNISLSLYGGMVFNRRLGYRDEHLGKVTVKNGTYIGLTLGLEI